MYMVMMVLDDEKHLISLLDAWVAAGVSGATVFESMGAHRIRACRARLHARFDFAHLADECEEEGHLTLFAIVPDEAAVQACLAGAERVVGDLDKPDTGVLAAWPLSVVKGVPGVST